MGDGSRDPDRGGAGRDAPAAGHVLLGGHIARQGPAIRASVAGVAVAEGARVGRGKAVRAGRRTSTATSASATAASHQAPTSITVTCGCPICGADFLSAFAENKVLEFLFNPYCETSAKLGTLPCCPASRDFANASSPRSSANRFLHANGRDEPKRENAIQRPIMMRMKGIMHGK